VSQEPPEDHITRKTVVCRVPGMEDVIVRSNLEYGTGDGAGLVMDVYLPRELEAGGVRPVVISVAGYPDPGMERIFGKPYKDWGASSSWARLIAASGMVAVTYANREPVADLRRLLDHLRRKGSALGIDTRRLGLFAASGHAPLALSALMESDPPARCAVLICPLLLDLDGSTAVADAATTFRFANPASGRTVEDLPADTALFIARAGKDQTPGLNQTLDRFVAGSLARNLDLTVINLAPAPHAFDLMHDGEASREAIREALRFLRFHLLDPPA
jgi:hypothetical protein